METLAPPKLMTAEELLRLPMGMGKRYELVEGDLRTMSPAGFGHGFVTMRLGARLQAYVEKKNLGIVAAAETGYRLRSNPDTVRAPDVSFVRQERVAQAGWVKGYFPGAPDLAVEVMSPDDTAEEIQAKIRDYFAAGTRLIWVVYPKTQQVAVYRLAHQSQILAGDEVLDGGEVVPGFGCSVQELFAGFESK